MEKRERVILHSDLNNFFASVEIANNPALAGKPLIVCGDPKERHVGLERERVYFVAAFAEFNRNGIVLCKLLKVKR
ncbi:MAG: hypothetical protein IIX18_00440 [Clostridia bacterium]|nr:hypothetical protein [Clostridia bacterium]